MLLQPLLCRGERGRHEEQLEEKEERREPAEHWDDDRPRCCSLAVAMCAHVEGAC